ncbi:MAG: hypothetical protein OEO84_10115 [Betaproteobacteria bacterium]|nr:hypothetical protein [Betaproteobacteria bacterium]
MQDEQRTASTWRIGFDLAAFVVLGAIAGMVAAMTLAGIAILLTGAGATTPAAAPETPVQAPAAQTMVAGGGAARAN